MSLTPSQRQELSDAAANGLNEYRLIDDDRVWTWDNGASWDVRNEDGILCDYYMVSIDVIRQRMHGVDTPRNTNYDLNYHA